MKFNERILLKMEFLRILKSRHSTKLIINNHNRSLTDRASSHTAEHLEKLNMLIHRSILQSPANNMYNYQINKIKSENGKLEEIMRFLCFFMLLLKKMHDCFGIVCKTSHF